MNEKTANTFPKLKLSNNLGKRGEKYIPAYYLNGKNIRIECFILPPDYGYSKKQIEESKSQAKFNAEFILNAVNEYDKLKEEMESWKKENFDNIDMADQTIKELKEDNAALLDALKDCNKLFMEIGYHQYTKQWSLVEKVKAAIKKAESK